MVGPARGALNALMLLNDEQRARGVVTFSAGNHGQGLAYAAREFGVACTVFMTENAVPTKVAAIQGYGATTRQFPTIQEAIAEMTRARDQTGAVFVSPFADEAVIAGQASVGLELLEQVEDLEQVVVPIGGGGLICGLALAFRDLRPDIRIVGVEPEGAPTMTRALAAVDGGGQARIVVFTTDTPLPDVTGSPADPSPPPPLLAELDTVGNDLARQREAAVNVDLTGRTLPGLAWLEFDGGRARTVRLLGCTPTRVARETVESAARGALIANGLGDYRIINRVLVER